MKKLFTILSILILFTFGVNSYAEMNDQPFAFPFIGRWQPSENPLLIDDFGFQDVQNLRREGKRLIGVEGHTKVNQNKIDATYFYPRSGFQFDKDNPSESHIIIQAYDEDISNSRLYQSKTIVPNMGEFESAVLHEDAAAVDKGRLSNAPVGNVVYANQKETRIWGGDEGKIAGFLIHHFPDSPADYWENVLVDDSDTYAQMAGATTFYIGANRRISKAKIYIKTANGAAVTTAVSEYVYPGTSWNPVANLSDGTNGLTQTGVISWDFNSATRSTFVLDDDIPAYWYQFQVDGVDANTEIYWITAGEGKFRRLENIWDGIPGVVGRFWVYDDSQHSTSGISDFTDYILEDLPNSFADLSTPTTSDYIYIGSPQKLRGFSLEFAESYVNSNASVLTAFFWDGSAWSGVTGLYDGTSEDGKTFAKTGWVHWLPTEEQSAVSGEATRTNYSSDKLFYYRIGYSGNLSGEIRIWYSDTIPAVPAAGDYKVIGNYRYPLFYQGRLILAGEETDKSKIRYSAFEAPNVFNGADSGELFIGGSESLTAGGIIYNVFQATGYEQLILTKSSETYRISGDGPENWIVQQMSSNVGCVAPQSFVVCEVAEITKDVKRNVAIWQASHGFVQSDGATLRDDMTDDINIYFERTGASRIAKHRIDDTYAWYDPDTAQYHALISSGAETEDEWGGDDTWNNEPVENWGTDWDNAITEHNVELVYSLKYNEWTKIDRTDSDGKRPLQIGFQAEDNDGKIYTYGAADDGFMYRLENGRTWDGNPIEQILWTKDLLIDEAGGKPLFNFTKIEKFRLMFTPKMSSISDEDITVEHYGDSQLSPVSGWLSQSTVSGVSMADIDGRNGQSTALGPFLKHSFKFTASTSKIDDGMELLGMALYYSSLEGWRQ